MFSALLAAALAVPAPVPSGPGTKALRDAVTAALGPLRLGAVGHAEQKTCFACHNQAPPMFAFATAKGRGFELPASLFTSQATHVLGFLETNRTRFKNGTGTGGAAATAGYALFTLELAGHKPDEDTAAVAGYLLNTQAERDHWRTTSNRPPTEASDFTTTYFAMRALRVWGPAAKLDAEKVKARTASARGWLAKADAKDTEDRAFRLLGLKETGADRKELATAAWELLRGQRPDGSWAQLDGGRGDAYATGLALVALHIGGELKVDAPAYRAGIAYLLKTQRADGTWFVKSRSKPFQPYYESGFPHEKDQFISIAASGWAAAALTFALPGR
ncbi:terpene cyclase/mutase family protein [Gemmata sp. JC673]|uniref:Terpene cyclase/mutase family protein n=1 Tax=Gemmata algarum TaxID=2975278 RepID=A0ABU5F763_9BACT|nr:prenyltransferase/squalene oxidase repeat-containing protein [Gemmata algarum]MDY3562560.1 terpene cyclase/mutase family protein [Gemmata algarum]